MWVNICDYFSDLPQANGIIENDTAKPEKTVVANGIIKHQVNGKNAVYVNGTCNRSEEDDDDEDFFLDTIEVCLKNNTDVE